MSDHRRAHQPNLNEQVLAVERAFLNLRGAVEILRSHVAAGKREPETLRMKESFLIDLEAATTTMKWLQKNEGAIKKLVSD